VEKLQIEVNILKVCTKWYRLFSGKCKVGWTWLRKMQMF